MHPSLARRVVYPLLQWKEGAHVRPRLRELERSQWDEPAALWDLQWRRLRTLLSHAYDRVPYYREVFDTCALHPREFAGLEDLRRLPILTKEVVRDRRRDLMAGPIGEPLVERRTSGSTGIPLVVYANASARDAWEAAARRAERWWGLDIGLRRVKLVNPHGKSRRAVLKQAVLMNHQEYSVFHLDEAVLDSLYRQAVRTRCEILAGYPSALGHFAHYLAARGERQRMRLKAVLTTGEVLYPDQRALLERVFACPVVNEYGSSECGHLAGECPAGNLHVAAENVLIEFGEAAGAASGGGSELIVTDLNNLAMPLLRYRIGDLGASGEPCACGRTLPVLHLGVGRTEDLLTLPDGRKVDGAVFGAAVEELIRQGVRVKQFRAIQHAPDHLEVLIVTEAPPQALSPLADLLQAMLDARLTVIVRAVDRIPAEETGKLRRFVSRLSAPKDPSALRRDHVGVAGGPSGA